MGGCIVSKEIPNKRLGLVWMPGLGFGTQYKFSTVSGVSSEEIRIYLRKLRQGAKEVSPIWLHKYEQNQLFFFQEQLSRSYLGQFSKVQPVQARYLVGCVLPTKILPICPTELNPWKDSLWDYIKKFSTRSST